LKTIRNGREGRSLESLISVWEYAFNAYCCDELLFEQGIGVSLLVVGEGRVLADG
jgi:hypothetical protein